MLELEPRSGHRSALLVPHEQEGKGLNGVKGREGSKAPTSSELSSRCLPQGELFGQEGGRGPLHRG